MSSSGKSEEEVKEKQEKDAEGILKFMASNGLVANPSKRMLLLMNAKQGGPLKISVGDSSIVREHAAKLLGVQVDGIEGTSP